MKNQSGHKTAKELFGWVESLVFAVVILVVVNSFFFRTTVVDGSSMEPTLYEPEYLLVSKLFYDVPEKGDIITFYSANYWDSVLVKRVIANEGDIVDIDYATGNVSVNGEYLDEPYILERIRFEDDIEMPYEVPEGCVFVMGDNRNGSMDSRNPQIGFIDEREILGKAVFLMMPGTHGGTEQAQYDRIGFEVLR